MSKQERASWASLIVESFVVAYYFSRVFAMAPDTGFASPEMLELIIGVVVLAIILGIASEIVLTVITRSKDAVDRDERDTLINAKAHRNGYLVLTTGVVLLIGQIVLTAVTPGAVARTPIPLSAFFIAHILLMVLMSASIAVYASRIFYYRRGY